MNKFKLYSKYNPQGDQPEAIDKIIHGIEKNYRFQTLLGVTGSGKTFTMANVIEKLNRPTLILSPNKILAVQLYREFKEFFPENKVEFFISYYDYYQPEAYLPGRDMYIEKDASINDVLQKMRLSTLKSVLTRRDVIVVASVSTIYASGNPEDFSEINLKLEVGKEYNRRFILESLAKMLYNRSEDKHTGGVFRFKGDILEIYPPYEDFGIRVEFFDEEVEKIYSFDVLNRTKIEFFDKITIYPASEFVTTEEKIKRAIESIKSELEIRVNEFKKVGKLLEAQRIQQRTLMDMELLETLGHCKGIENYSRHFDNRKAGDPPWTLLDYFDKDFITFIDESHIAIPQLRAMWAGDHSRKRNLIEYGFRLPSAYDNRPLKFEEFIERINQTIFVSATPGPFELEHSEQIVEQIIRPTGLIDPEVVVKPTIGQVDDFIAELKKAIKRNERAIAVVLTKKDAEMLADHLNLLGIKASYLHSELDAMERSEVIRKLRSGDVDVVIGVNLLREGLDLPEVSLVAIMDSDREGFLRSETTLIQTIGRAARNINGKVILYADKITDAMQNAIYETNRRRKLQMDYNKTYKITPKSIVKELPKNIFEQFMEKVEKPEFIFEVAENTTPHEYIQLLEMEMFKAASELRYEDAAKYRDEIKKVKKKYRIKN